MSSTQDFARTRTPCNFLSVMPLCFQTEAIRQVSRLRLLSICLVRVAMGVQQNSTCNSNKYILTNSFFQPTDKIASFVTHRTYSCPNYEKFYVTCNSSNLIHTITCSDCLMQYVGESAQQLNMRFVTHRASISGKIKSNSCKWLAGHFSTWV